MYGCQNSSIITSTNELSGQDQISGRILKATAASNFNWLFPKSQRCGNNSTLYLFQNLVKKGIPPTINQSHYCQC